MPKTSALRSERLLLRPFLDSDLPDFFACCRNPQLGYNGGWKPHETLEESNQVFHEFFLTKKLIWAIVIQKSCQLVGSIGLLEDPSRQNPKALMAGYWIAEEQWGKGFASEALKTVVQYASGELSVDLITANCYPDNYRSQRVLERNGFIREGILHQAEMLYNGEIRDHICYYLPLPIHLNASSCKEEI